MAVEHANIMGIEIRDMEAMEGMEEPLYRGDLYMDGKKIGSFEEDRDGGPTAVYVESPVSDELRSRMDLYFQSLDLELEDEEDYDLFFLKLIELEELLGVYKEARKKGRAFLVADYTGDDAALYEADNEEGVKELVEAQGLEDYDVYGSLEDFVICQER